MSAPYAAGFRTLDEEVSERRLPVEGDLPSWLDGVLVRNGPGAFEAGGESFDHWFDGLGMLRRFAVADGAVTYTNRFLRSETYERAREGAYAGQFGTSATGNGLRERLRAALVPRATDNANVHVQRVGDRAVATTETTRAVEFDPATLDARGEWTFDDDLTAHHRCSHPIRDPETGAMWNVATRFGRQSTYSVRRRAAGETARTEVATVPVDRPAYVHSFALSESHVVIVESPLVVHPLRLLAPGTTPFIERYRWRPARGTRFTVVDRATGEVVGRPRAPPFFCFHQVGAFEDGDDVVVDLVAFEDASAVSALSLDALRAGDAPGLAGSLLRCRVPLDGDADAVDVERRHEGITLPRIAPGRHTRGYRYAYGQSPGDAGFATGVVKVDVPNGTATTWRPDGETYPGEPVFVPRPGGTAEDDGVLLVVALDGEAERSVLHCLDAQTLAETGRAPLPHVLPFDFHGRFWSR
ncbi:MAG: carotenoid oxygenase family protein [Halobacteriaceae archaeon]